MKLSANIPLESKRDDGLALIDDIAAQKVSDANRLELIYAEKTAIASNILNNGAEAPELFTQEALLRGLTVKALCQLIVENNTKAKLSLIELEKHRQIAKSEIRNATSEQQIKLIGKTFSSLEV